MDEVHNILNLIIKESRDFGPFRSLLAAQERSGRMDLQSPNVPLEHHLPVVYSRAGERGVAWQVRDSHVQVIIFGEHRVQALLALLKVAAVHQLLGESICIPD